MGATEVNATIIGEIDTREYTFLVDTGATYLGLPLEEIQALGLQRSLGIIRLMTATGVIEVEPYFANGEFRGRRFGALMVPTAMPSIGYEFLQNLRYKVNPVTQEIEAVADHERHPPYG